MTQSVHELETSGFEVSLVLIEFCAISFLLTITCELCRFKIKEREVFYSSFTALNLK